MEIAELRKLISELPDTLPDEEWWKVVGDAELLVLKKRVDDKRAALSK